MGLIVFVLAMCASAFGQSIAIQGTCTQGAKQAVVSGIKSTNYLQGIVPSCTVTPYLTGTTTLASYSLTFSGTTQTGPFTAGGSASANPGGWLLYTSSNAGLDIVLSGGISPNIYSQPVTLVNIIPGGGQGGTVVIIGFGPPSGSCTSGNIYFNSNAGYVQYVCGTDAAYHATAGGGGGSFPGNPTTAGVGIYTDPTGQVNSENTIIGGNGVSIIGDSNSCYWGILTNCSSGVTGGWAQGIAAAIGTGSYNFFMYGLSGNNMADCAENVVMYKGTIPTVNNSANFMLCGTNDAGFLDSSAPTQLGFRENTAAAVGWLATPAENNYFASNTTYFPTVTGTWTQPQTLIKSFGTTNPGTNYNTGELITYTCTGGTGPTYSVGGSANSISVNFASYSITSNVATVVLAIPAMNPQVNAYFQVTGGFFNGLITQMSAVSGSPATSFSFPYVHADVSSTADSGSYALYKVLTSGVFVSFGAGCTNIGVYPNTTYPSTTNGAGVGNTGVWYISTAQPLVASTNGSLQSVDLSVPPSGTVDLYYGQVQTSTGTATVTSSVNGLLTDYYSKSSTLSSQIVGRRPVNQINGQVPTIAQARFTGLTPGIHKFTINATAGFQFISLGIPQPHERGTGSPNVTAGGVPPQGILPDGTNTAYPYTLIFSGLIQGVTQDQLKDGLNVGYADMSNLDQQLDYLSALPQTLTGCSVSGGVATVTGTGFPSVMKGWTGVVSAFSGGCIGLNGAVIAPGLVTVSPTQLTFATLVSDFGTTSDAGLFTPGSGNTYQNRIANTGNLPNSEKHLSGGTAGGHAKITGNFIASSKATGQGTTDLTIAANIISHTFSQGALGSRGIFANDGLPSGSAFPAGFCTVNKGNNPICMTALSGSAMSQVSGAQALPNLFNTTFVPDNGAWALAHYPNGTIPQTPATSIPGFEYIGGNTFHMGGTALATITTNSVGFQDRFCANFWNTGSSASQLTCASMFLQASAGGPTAEPLMAIRLPSSPLSGTPALWISGGGSAAYRFYTAGSGGGTVKFLSPPADISITPFGTAGTYGMAVVSGSTTNTHQAVFNATGALIDGGAPGSGITLTTTGSSGPATLVGSTLNIPVYTAGGGGVASFTGDGALLNNSGSTGSVTATLATAAAHKFWGNNTGSTAAPGYQSIGTGDLPTGIPNANLLNPSTTVNGQTCTLGSTCTITTGSVSGTGTISKIPVWTASNALGDSLLDDGLTLATALTYNGAGGVRAVSFTTTGSTNGAVNLTSTGTPPGAAAANTVQLTVPNSVTPYTLTFPGAAPAANGYGFSCTTAGVCSFAPGAAGTVNAGTGLAYYTTPGGTAVSGANITGIPYANGSSAPTTATFNQLLAAFNTNQLNNSGGALYLPGDSVMQGLIGSNSNNSTTQFAESLPGLIAQSVLHQSYPGYNFAVAGTNTNTIIASIFKNFQPPNPTGFIPKIVMDNGINDAINFNNGGTPSANMQNQYTAGLIALIGHVTTPVANHFAASTCTQTTGVWANNANFFGNQSAWSGTDLQISSSGAVLTCNFTTTVNNQRIIPIWGGVGATSGGQFNLAVDGPNQTALCSGTTTYYAYGCNTSSLVDRYGQDITVATAGVHTLTITTTNASAVDLIEYVLVPPAVAAPPAVLVISDVPVQHSSASAAVQSAATVYGGLNSAAVTAEATGGLLPVAFANLRTGSYVINNSTDYTGGGCSYNLGLIPNHPDCIGVSKWANSVVVALNSLGSFAYPGLGGVQPSDIPVQSNNAGSTYYTNFPNGFTVSNPTAYANFSTWSNINGNSLLGSTSTWVPGLQFDTNGSSFFEGIGGAINLASAPQNLSLGFLSTNGWSFLNCPATATSPAGCTLPAFLDSSGNLSLLGSPAVSKSALLFSGTIQAGGTATTNFPTWFIQPTAASAVTSWSTAGTAIGVNTATGFTGNFLDFHVNGSSTLFRVNASGALTLSGNISTGAQISGATYVTASNCSNAAAPAVCGSSAAGAVTIPAGSTTVTVNTTAVTANSRITLTADDSLTIAATTCNSTLASLVGGMAVTGRVAGTSFTVTYNGTIITNPLCLSYSIVN